MTPRLSGRPSLYRGKVQQPLVVKLTPEGHAALAEGLRGNPDCRTSADYVEKLLRRAVRRPVKVRG